MPSEADRYIFRTRGVCPPEIHFQVHGNILTEVNFRGGGCPGNAELVSRLIKGRSITEVRPFLKGIPCQNGTSCPDQLDRALEAVQRGDLQPAHSFRIAADPWPKDRLALVGSLEGSLEAWEALREEIKKEKINDIFCVGGLTDPRKNNGPLLKRVLQAKKVQAVMNDQDWSLSRDIEAGKNDALGPEERAYVVTMSQALSFEVDGIKGLAFFGRYLQDLPGYSDYEPFALEMNMVTNLAQFMEDGSVFQALEAMTPQFQARLVIFGQSTVWKHWRVGGVDFVGVGSTVEEGRARWGLLTARQGSIKLEIREFALAG